MAEKKSAVIPWLQQQETEEETPKTSSFGSIFDNISAWGNAAYANTRELGMGKDIKNTFDKLYNRQYSDSDEKAQLIADLDRLQAERDQYRNDFQENQEILNQNDSMLKDFTEVGGTMQGIWTQAKDTAIGAGTGAVIGSAVPVLGTGAGFSTGARVGNFVGSIHQAVNDADMNAVDAWERVLQEGGNPDEAEQAYKDAFWNNMPTEALDIIKSMYIGGKLTGVTGKILNRALGGRLAGTLTNGVDKVARFDIPAKIGTAVAQATNKSWLGQGVGIGLDMVGSGLEERIQEPWQDYATERAIDIQRRRYDPTNKLNKDVKDFSITGEGGLLDYYTTPEGMETGWKAQKMGMVFGGVGGLLTKSEYTKLGTAHSDSIQAGKQQADWIEKHNILKDEGNLERYNQVKETMGNIYGLTEDEKADLSVEDVSRMYHEYYANKYGVGGNRQEQGAVTQADFLNEITGEETARRGLMGDTATKYIDEFSLRPDSETLQGIHDNQQVLSEEQVQEALEQDEQQESEETTGTEDATPFQAKASKPNFFDNKTAEQAKNEKAQSQTENVIKKKKGIPDQFGNWKKIDENDDFDHDLNNIGAEAKFENTKTGRIAHIKRTKSGYQVQDITNPNEQTTVRNKKGKKKLLSFLKSSFANQKTAFQSDGSDGQVQQALPKGDGVISEINSNEITKDAEGNHWFNGKKIQSKDAYEVHSMQDLHDYYKNNKDKMSADLYAEISRQMMRFGIGSANNTSIVLDLSNSASEAGGFGSETVFRTDPNDPNSAIAHAVVRLYAGADLATAAHEIAHLGWMNLSDQDRATFAKWAEKTQGEFVAKVLGMNYDQNFRSYLIEALTNRESETSKALWREIQRQGAVQQTLAILNGQNAQNYDLAVEERFAWEFSNWYAQGYIKGSKPRNIIERILNKACATLQGALNLLSDTNRYLNGEDGYNGGEINSIFTNMSTERIGQPRQTVAPQEQVELRTEMNQPIQEQPYNLGQGVDETYEENLYSNPTQNLGRNTGTVGAQTYATPQVEQKPEQDLSRNTGNVPKMARTEGVTRKPTKYTPPPTVDQRVEQMNRGLQNEYLDIDNSQTSPVYNNLAPSADEEYAMDVMKNADKTEGLEAMQKKEAAEREKAEKQARAEAEKQRKAREKEKRDKLNTLNKDVKDKIATANKSLNAKKKQPSIEEMENQINEAENALSYYKGQEFFARVIENQSGEISQQDAKAFNEYEHAIDTMRKRLNDIKQAQEQNKSVEKVDLTSDNQNATMVENQEKQEVADSGETENTRGEENLQPTSGEVQGRGSVRQGNDNRTGERRVGQDAVEGRSEGNGKDISLLKDKEIYTTYNKRKEKKTELKDWRNMSGDDELKQVYVDALNASKEADTQHGVYVDGQTVESLKDCKVVLHKNKMAGFAITKDGNIVGVFSNPKNPIRGILNDMIFIAHMMGGNRMDCFGKFLLRGYRNCGFTPVARTTFAEEYYPADNPANSTIRKEKPDVFFLVKDNDNNTTYLNKMNNGEYKNDQIAVDDIPLIDSEDSYGDALGFQGQVLEETKKKENKDKSTKEIADSLRPKEETKPQTQETTEQTQEEQTEAKEEPKEKVQQEETNYDKAKKYVEKRQYISLQIMKDELEIPVKEGMDIIKKLEEESIIESSDDITDTRYIVPEHLRKYPEYWAWVKYEDANGRKHLEIMRRHYPTKKAFQDDLKGNGITVYFISTKENWDRDSEAYHKRLEENRTRSKIRSRTKRSLEKYDKEREKRLEEQRKELDKELEGLSPEEKEKKIQERHDNAIKTLNKMLEDSKKEEKEKLDKFIEKVKNDKNYRENTAIYVKKHSDGRVYAEAYTREDSGYVNVTPEATISNYNDYDSLYTLYPELLNEEDFIENDFEDKHRYSEDIYDEEGIVEAMFEDVSDSDAKTAQDVLQKKIDKETDKTRKSFYKKVMSKIGSYISKREHVSDDDGVSIKNLSGVGGGEINIYTSFGEQEFIDDIDSVYKRYLQIKKNENKSKKIAEERDNLLKKWEEQSTEQEKRENYKNGKKTINEVKEELKKTVNNWSDDFYEAMKNSMTEEETDGKPIIYHASMSKKVDGKNKIVEYNEIRVGKKKIRDLTEEEKKINATVEKATEAAQSYDDLIKELDTLIPERKQTSPKTKITTEAKQKTTTTKTQTSPKTETTTTQNKSDENYQRAVELVLNNRGMSPVGLRLALEQEGINVGYVGAEKYLTQMEEDGLVEGAGEGSMRIPIDSTEANKKTKKGNNPDTHMQEAGQAAENQTLLTPEKEAELEKLFWKLIRKKEFHGMDKRWNKDSLDYYRSLYNRMQGKDFNPEYVMEDKAFLTAIKNVNDYINKNYKEYKNLYRGVDGHWRFEFSDKDAHFLNGFEKLSGKTLDTTLEKILKHDNLYKFYSKLKEMPVHLVRNEEMQRQMEDTENNYYAMYDPETKSIYINSDMFEKDDVRNSLLHEIQHAIQDIEGFANGTNDNAYNNNYDFSEGEKQAVLTEKRSNMSDEELQNNPRYETLNPEEKTIMSEQRPVKKVAKSPDTKMQSNGQTNLGYIDKQKDIYSVTFTKSAQKNGENQKKIAFYRNNKSYWRENKDAQTGSITFTRALPYRQHQKTIIYDDINGKTVGRKKKTKVKEYIEAAKDQIIKWLFNDKHFLKKAARNVGAIEAYMRMMVMKDQGAVAGAAIEDGIVKHNGKNGERTKSLNSIIEAVGEENQTEFLKYCEAYRVLDLEKRNIYQKMTPQYARDEIAKVQRSKNAKLFEEQRKNFVEYNHELLWVLVDGGFITEKQYDKFIQNDPNFIPLSKNMDELEGYVDGFRDSKTMINVQHPMHKIGTSMGEVANPFLEMQKRTVEYYVKASRNKAGLIFVHDIAEAIAQTAGGNVVAQNQGMIRKLASRDKNGKPISHDNKQYVFYVWENGQKQYYQVADREIYVALKSFDAEQMGALSKIANQTAGLASRLVRDTATMTPDFGLRNLVRDNVEAFISSEHGFLPLIDSLWGMYQMANDTQWFKEYQALNGEHLSLNRDGENVATVEHDIKDNVKFYKSIVPLFKKDLHEFTDTKRSVPARLKSLLKLVAFDIIPLQALYKGNKRLNDYLETGTRIGEYRNARMGYRGLYGRLFEGKGNTIFTNDADLKMAQMDKMFAAYKAKDITLNFGQHGRLGKEVNKYIPFFNASLQGIYKVCNTLENMVRADDTRLKQELWFKFVLMGAMGMAAALAGTGDDDYDEAPEYEHDNFWVFKDGFRLPKDQLFGRLVGGTVEKATRQYLKDGDVKKLELLKDVLGNFAIDKCIPALADLAMGLYGDEGYDSFRNKPVVPSYMVDWFGYQKKDLSTSKLAADISEGLLNVFGVDVAAKKIDFVFSKTLSNLGNYTKGLYDLGTNPNERMTRGAEPEDKGGFAEKSKELPYPLNTIVGTFATNRNTFQSVSDFYNRYKELKKFEHAPERMSKAEKKVWEAYKKAYKDDKKYRDALKAIKQDKSLTGAQKRERADKIFKQQIRMARKLRDYEKKQGLI